MEKQENWRRLFAFFLSAELIHVKTWKEIITKDYEIILDHLDGYVKNWPPTKLNNFKYTEFGLVCAATI